MAGCGQLRQSCSLPAADRLNRIYCYLFRPFYDSTVAEEFTLDELLAYARQAVGQS